MCVGLDTRKFNPLARVLGDKNKFVDPLGGMILGAEKRTRDIQQAGVPQPMQAAMPSSTGATMLTPGPAKPTGGTYLTGAGG